LLLIVQAKAAVFRGLCRFCIESVFFVVVFVSEKRFCIKPLSVFVRINFVLLIDKTV